MISALSSCVSCGSVFMNVNRLSRRGWALHMGRAAHFPGGPGPWLRAVLAAVVGAGALAGPTVAAPRAADSALARRLAQALVVPHVAAGGTGAEAFDLETGDVVF